jgi:hypothetical protein
MILLIMHAVFRQQGVGRPRPGVGGMHLGGSGGRMQHQVQNLFGRQVPCSNESIM